MKCSIEIKRLFFQFSNFQKTYNKILKTIFLQLQRSLVPTVFELQGSFWYQRSEMKCSIQVYTVLFLSVFEFPKKVRPLEVEISKKKLVHSLNRNKSNTKLKFEKKTPYTSVERTVPLQLICTLTL